MKDLLSRLTSRKFLLAVIASITAYGVATQDGIITQGEIWTIITPVLTFIGFEGAADVVTRATNIPPVDDEKSTVKSKT